MNLIQPIIDLLGENGEHWTQGSFAINNKGETVHSSSSEAEKRCIVGAASHTAKTNEDWDRVLNLLLLSQPLERNPIAPALYNDHSGWPDIARLLQRALKIEERENEKVTNEKR